ncbi:hypothetical protein [Subtercola endophyticus]|uniref:hypothetical protein n=1 Tax=Subtercola endophyticus TaxID=2895559 RepID=UPI001E4F88E3|nr:hypothetical protein [Subtercola endophyticus]UFS57911.1 hypothetical protein LQ955_12825 [Subtercola endophyticus]
METTVTRTPAVSAQYRVVRPIRSLLVQSRAVVAVLTLPVFAAMLWFAIPRGTWPRVLIAMAVVGVLYLVAISLFSRVRIEIEPDGITENGFFVHNRRFAAKRIASAVIVPVYRGQTLETTPQLFVLDATGELLLRMRGQFWSEQSVQAVATAYGVPLRIIAEPLTRQQFRADFPDLVFWFERWPWVRIACLVGGISALSLLLIALLSSANG